MLFAETGNTPGKKPLFRNILCRRAKAETKIGGQEVRALSENGRTASIRPILVKKPQPVFRRAAAYTDHSGYSSIFNVSVSSFQNLSTEAISRRSSGE